MTAGWTVKTDLGLCYVIHEASFDMLIMDPDLQVIENDLAGREIPRDVQFRALEVCTELKEKLLP